MYCAGRISTYGEDPNDPILLLSRVLDYGVIRLLEEQIELKKAIQLCYCSNNKKGHTFSRKPTHIDRRNPKDSKLLGRGVDFRHFSLTNSTAMSPLATASMASGTQKTWGV